MNTLVICPKCEKLNRVALAAASKSTPICGNCKTNLPLHDGVQDVSGSALTKLMGLADRPLVVDFWAEWCGPCRALAPKLEEVAQELGPKVKIVKVNVDENPGTPGKYGIRGIPAMILFKGGSEVGQLVGNHPKDAILEFLNKNV